MLVACSQGPGDASLGNDCTQLIKTADEVYFSAVTPWELGIERALGKINYPDGLISALEASGLSALAISASHGELAAQLPPHHRDPFDRMLVAQAQSDSLMLVSADHALDSYDVEVIDARL